MLAGEQEKESHGLCFAQQISRKELHELFNWLNMVFKPVGHIAKVHAQR